MNCGAASPAHIEKTHQHRLTSLCTAEKEGGEEKLRVVRVCVCVPRTENVLQGNMVGFDEILVALLKALAHSACKVDEAHSTPCNHLFATINQVISVATWCVCVCVLCVCCVRAGQTGRQSGMNAHSHTDTQTQTQTQTRTHIHTEHTAYSALGPLHQTWLCDRITEGFAVFVDLAKSSTMS